MMSGVTHKQLFMQLLAKTRNHHLYNRKTHISDQPGTPFLDPNSPSCGAKLHCEPPSHLTLPLWVRPVPSSKPFKTWTASTRSAHGSFNAKKFCKNRSISSGHGCSTLVGWSLWPVFGLRLAPPPLVSASNKGIISFPNEKSNGSHSALLNSQHRKRQFGLRSGALWHSTSVSNRTTWRPPGLSK